MVAGLGWVRFGVIGFPGLHERILAGFWKGRLSRKKTVRKGDFKNFKAKKHPDIWMRQDMHDESCDEKLLDEVKSGDLRYRKPDVYGGCAGKLERDLQSAQERIKQLEKDVADRDLWLAGKNASISYNAEQISELGGKLMMVTAERDAARANVEELEKLKTDPKPAITVSYSLIIKDGARIDGPKDSVMEVARLTKENEELKQKNKQLRSRIEEIRITTAQALNDSANAPV